ncbi:Kelch-like protein 3 [Seminavis robusta]|uniref:Kelch-like protein 3 n=1 Tax=Seminavis robusta TaxID=568900 RepID=A0A9N8DIH5_9STRA|nr:Kelch-like protein 3 [Seminavis robusta]|eukprot:Sro81_g043410.1 Kelch-like protein 3 (480) ;mRNA; f:33711-35150
MSSAYKLMGSLGAEVSLATGVATALDDETFHDVTLVASDGVEVPANRVLLAVRSKVFKAMLMGGFSEATSPSIQVNFPGAVVNTVVEYIYTSKAKLLTELNPDNVEKNGDISEPGQEEFQMLVSLTAAAAYYNLPTLCDKVNSIMDTFVQKFPSLSFAVLEACAQEHPAISDNLLEMALSNIRQNKYETLNEGLLCALSSSVLAVILGDEKSVAPENKRFAMVQIWSKGASGGKENRQDLAKELVKDHLKLHWICPCVLANSVAASGLVDIEHLAEAYKQQAMMAKHQYGEHFEQAMKGKQKYGENFEPLRFDNSVWSGSNSITFWGAARWQSGKLTCPPLANGFTYKWTIDTTGVSAADHIMIGVAKCSATLNNNTFCGRQSSCWMVYGRDGVAWYSGGEKEYIGNGAIFGNGSRVNITLDLSPNETNNGSFSISVNGAASVIITRNMKVHTNTDGYVPMVSCEGATSAKILHIEQVL